MAAYQEAEWVFFQPNFSRSNSLDRIKLPLKGPTDEETRTAIVKLRKMVKNRVGPSDYLSFPAVSTGVVSSASPRAIDLTPRARREQAASKQTNPRVRIHSRNRDSRLYGSQPVLVGEVTRKTRSRVSESLPTGINVAGLDDTTRRKLVPSESLLKQFKFADNLLVTDEEYRDIIDEDEDMEGGESKEDGRSRCPRGQQEEGAKGDLLTQYKKEAEDEVTHDWLLQGKFKDDVEKFNRKKHRLTVRVPDEDPMVAIERRLDEIRLMAKPRRDGRYVLDRIDQEQRDLITVSGPRSNLNVEPNNDNDNTTIVLL